MPVRLSELAYYDVLPDPLLVSSNDVLTYANPAAARLFGAASPDELIGLPIAEMTPAADRGRLLDRAKSAAAGHATPPIRAKLVRLDGSVVDVEVTGRPALTAAGEPAAIVSMRDITERVSEETMFRATFEQAAVGIAHIALDGTWLRVNRRFAQIVGHDYDQLLSRTFADITHPDDRAADARSGAALLDGTVEILSMNKRCLAAGGEVVWVHLTGSIVHRSDGSADYFLAVAEDISAEREAEQKLQASERRFRHLVEQAGELIVILSADGTVRYVAPTVQAVMGYEPAELIGSSAFDLVHPADRPDALGRLRRLIAEPGGRERSTLRLRVANGGWRTFAVYSRNLLHEPSVGGIVINAQDRTEPIRLTEELAQMRRVESLGRVAASVAHEFNNVLAAAGAFADVLVRKAPDHAPVVHQIKDALGRGKQIANQILRWSTPIPVTKQSFDVRKWLHALADELQTQIGGRNPVSVEIAPDVSTVDGDRGQLSQVVTNLVLNARDASVGGAPITISASRLADRALVLSVSDEGTGISSDALDRLFEPMFTTKRSGTGLGLPIAQQIILSHGGSLSVDSEVGEGSTFTLTLP